MLSTLLASSFVLLLSLSTGAIPPALPLAVRSPTFNIWLQTQNGYIPSQRWTRFSDNYEVMGWAMYIRVDGTTFRCLGTRAIEGIATTFDGATITPTRTILRMQAGAVAFNVTFLSPIEPNDLARQSLPMSYVYVDGAATDGKEHTIQLYMDLSGEWTTFAGPETTLKWQSENTTHAAYMQAQRAAPSSAFNNVAEDGIAIHAMAFNTTGRQSLIASDRHLRSQIVSNETTLSLTSDLTGFQGPLTDPDTDAFPVLAHYADLGTVHTIPTTMWAVGIVRDPVVTFQGAPRHAYWWSRWATLSDAVDAFVEDFPAAQERALALDAKILADASKVSSEYADLVSLGLRQALAGIEVTVPQLSDGSYNTSDVMAFMKDSGISQRVNPTDTMYALMPALMYMNSTLLGFLLEPLLRFQANPTSGYTNSYAAPDLGTPYPSAPGNALNNEGTGVEHSANMLIMVLAHARTSGDGALISRYYTTLKAWANYLAHNAVSTSQMSADSRIAVLQQKHAGGPNLGIKAIAGIAAMARISDAAGDAAGADTFRATVANLTQTWTGMSSFQQRLAWQYNEPESSGMMYNLFADKLLQLDVFPDSVYQAADSYFATVGPYGAPLSSDSNSMTRSDWTMLSAAASSSSTIRDLLITGVHAGVWSNNNANGTFSALYNVQTGRNINEAVLPNGYATPAQGAMFALLALNVPTQTISGISFAGESGAGSTPSSPNSHKKRTSITTIVGAALGAVWLLAILGIGLFFLRRRRRRNRTHTQIPSIASASGSASGSVTDSSASMRESSTITLASGPGRGGAYADPSPLPGHSQRHTSLIRPPSKIAQLSPEERRRLYSLEEGAEEDLRRDMENLRRQVVELRATYQTPPVYY